MAEVDLEDEELVDDIERGADAHLLGGGTSAVEISLERLWIGWELDSLATQQKYIAFHFLVKFFVHLLKTVGN